VCGTFLAAIVTTCIGNKSNVVRCQLPNGWHGLWSYCQAPVRNQCAEMPVIGIDVDGGQLGNQGSLAVAVELPALELAALLAQRHDAEKTR